MEELDGVKHDAVDDDRVAERLCWRVASERERARKFSRVRPRARTPLLHERSRSRGAALRVRVDRGAQGRGPSGNLRGA
jgi:hypothetical protein